MTNRCATCHYWRILSGVSDGHKQVRACHYALDAKELRGCRPEECDKFKWREGKHH